MDRRETRSGLDATANPLGLRVRCLAGRSHDAATVSAPSLSRQSADLLMFASQTATQPRRCEAPRRDESKAPWLPCLGDRLDDNRRWRYDSERDDPNAPERRGDDEVDRGCGEGAGGRAPPRGSGHHGGLSREAVNTALGSVVPTTAAPEALERRVAKDTLDSWILQHKTEAERVSVRRTLAQLCALDEIQRRCPSFELFRKELAAARPT